MTPALPVTPRARLLTGLAVAGAVPLTAGVILWIAGTVMGSAYHGRWGAVASLGGLLAVTGLGCGLVMFVAAGCVVAVTPRRIPPGPAAPTAPTPAAPDLVPLASPEQHPLLIDPRSAVPQPPPSRPPQAGPWTDDGMPSGWTDSPDG